MKVYASDVNFYENVLALRIFVKTCNIRFHQTPSRGSQTETSDQNDVQRDPHDFFLHGFCLCALHKHHKMMVKILAILFVDIGDKGDGVSALGQALSGCE
jgi:hypothetical protein